MQVYNAETRQREELRGVVKTHGHSLPYVRESGDGNALEILHADPALEQVLEQSGAHYDARQAVWRYAYDTLDDAIDFLRKLEGMAAIEQEFLAAIGDWSGAVVELRCREPLPNGDWFDAQVSTRETWTPNPEEPDHARRSHR